MSFCCSDAFVHVFFKKEAEHKTETETLQRNPHFWLYGLKNIWRSFICMNAHRQSDLCQRKKRDPAAGSNPTSVNCEILSYGTL